MFLTPAYKERIRASTLEHLTSFTLVKPCQMAFAGVFYFNSLRVDLCSGISYKS